MELLRRQAQAQGLDRLWRLPLASAPVAVGPGSLRVVEVVVALQLLLPPWVDWVKGRLLAQRIGSQVEQVEQIEGLGLLPS